MKKKPIYGLKPSQLTRLLSVSARIAESVDDMSDDQIKETMLRDHLDRRLSEQPSFKESLRSAGGQSTADGLPPLDKSFKEVLLDPQCSMAMLLAIKDHSKRLSATVTSGSETVITTTIYYAAIAAALVYHDERISKYSCENLAQRFSLLAQKRWVDSEFQALFARAAEWCRQNTPCSQ